MSTLIASHDGLEPTPVSVFLQQQANETIKVQRIDSGVFVKGFRKIWFGRILPGLELPTPKSDRPPIVHRNQSPMGLGSFFELDVTTFNSFATLVRVLFRPAAAAKAGNAQKHKINIRSLVTNRVFSEEEEEKQLRTCPRPVSSLAAPSRGSHSEPACRI